MVPGCVCRYAFFSLLASALLFQSCASPAIVTHESISTKLRVYTLPYLSSAPFFIAKEEGYFGEQHLQVEFVELRDSLESVLALSQGELDVLGDFITTGLFSTIARGGRIKIVADKGHVAAAACPSIGILARRQLIENGKLKPTVRLRDLRISYHQSSSIGYITDKLLLSAGLTLDSLSYRKIPTAATPEALKRDAIDLVSLSEPWLTRIVRDGNSVVWLSAEKITPEFQFAAVVYGKRLLYDDPDAGRRFMQAYLKAVRKYNEGKTARNLDILAAYTRLDKELLAAACWPAIRPDGWINTRSLLEFQAWAAKRKMLEYPAKEDQLWDPSFIQYIQKNP